VPSLIWPVNVACSEGPALRIAYRPAGKRGKVHRFVLFNFNNFPLQDRVAGVTLEERKAARIVDLFSHRLLHRAAGRRPTHHQDRAGPARRQQRVPGRRAGAGVGEPPRGSRQRGAPLVSRAKHITPQHRKTVLGAITPMTRRRVVGRIGAEPTAEIERDA
ncbi:MAG: hypothetical protein ACRCU1_00415, partial [Alsobacter sp.]